MWMKVVFIIVTCVQVVFPTSRGAAPLACENMTPSHGGNQAQTSPSPIEIIVQESITAGQKLNLTIRSPSIDFTFRGYLVQAQTLSTNLIGSFTQILDEINVLDCLDLPNSAATHNNSLPKTEIVLEWEAPAADSAVPFNFFVTVVQSFDVFWVKVRSPLVVLLPDTATPPTEPTTPPNDSELDPIFEGCGERKTCFGVPNECYLRKNCNLFGAVTYDSGNFAFELLSMVNAKYIAMGLSFDRRMEDDSVIECVEAIPNIISPFTSWTKRNPADASRADIDQNIITLIESRNINGRIYCKVDRDANTTINGVRFDLMNQKFHLLLASGDAISVQSITFHGVNRGYSDEAVLLTDPRNVGSNTSISILLLIHGAFMIVAWIGLSSIGIVIVRHFKSSWHGRKIGGKDVWFVWHVLCMFLTWALTLTAFIIIFVELGEWRTTVHSVLGCVVLGLSCIQTIGAVFRPTPTEIHRPIFNWMHKAFGHLAHFLAVVAIFFAVQFPAASLPQYTFYILIAFATFYVLMHIIFMTVQIGGNLKKQKRLGNSTSKDAPYNILQKTLFGFFVISITTIVIVLLVVFTLDL